MKTLDNKKQCLIENKFRLGKLLTEKLNISRMMPSTIEDRELEFFEAIKSAQNFVVTSDIKYKKWENYINNQILNISRTELRGGTFVRKGAFGECKLVKDGDIYLVDKTLIDETYKLDFCKEKRILIDFANDNVDYVVKIDKDVFAEDNNNYRMEFINDDLQDFVERGDKTYNIDLIKQLINIGISLRNLNVLHRDLHSGNFLVRSNEDSSITLKICDFGLSKTIDKPYDCIGNYHNLYKRNRNGYGRKDFVHKKQIKNLSNADFSTETYSFAKLINYILTGNPGNCEHEYKDFCKKAIALNYADIIEMFSEMQSKQALSKNS